MMERHTQPGVDTMNERMKSMFLAIYGGGKIACWLSGLKQMLILLGTFSTIANHPGYELTDACASAIKKTLVRDAELRILPA
jgi:hypothetical protein